MMVQPPIEPTVAASPAQSPLPSSGSDPNVRSFAEVMAATPPGAAGAPTVPPTNLVRDAAGARSLFAAFGELPQLVQQASLSNQRFRAEEQTLLDQGIGKGDPRYSRLMTSRLADLQDLQLRVQELQFRIELGTKVVEHGSSAVKESLRTQV